MSDLKKNKRRREEEEEEEEDQENEEGDSGEESGEDDGEDEESEAEPEPKVLPQRQTRGKRLSEVMAEGDEEFWAQAAWAEEQADNDYELSDASEDVPDSDFFESEADESSDEEEEVKERASKKKGYVDPGRKKAAAAPRKKTSTAVKEEAGGDDAAMAVDEDSAVKRERVRVKREPTIAGELRKSSRSTTVENTFATLQKEAEKQSSTRVKREAKTYRALTQEELLKEAEQTEIENRKSLEQLLKIEEDRKRIHVKKTAASGPKVIYHSDRTGNTITFTQREQLPPFLQQIHAPASPSVPKCAVTGAAARYIDPVSKQAYSDATAYKQLAALPPPQPRAAPARGEAAAAASNPTTSSSALNLTSPISSLGSLPSPASTTKSKRKRDDTATSGSTPPATIVSPTASYPPSSLSPANATSAGVAVSPPTVEAEEEKKDRKRSSKSTSKSSTKSRK